MAKHLTYDDRLEIEKYLKMDFSLSEMSRVLNRHKLTISREITLRSPLNRKVAMVVISMHVFIDIIVI